MSEWPDDWRDSFFPEHQEMFADSSGREGVEYANGFFWAKRSFIKLVESYTRLLGENEVRRIVNSAIDGAQDGFARTSKTFKG